MANKSWNSVPRWWNDELSQVVSSAPTIQRPRVPIPHHLCFFVANFHNIMTNSKFYQLIKSIKLWKSSNSVLGIRTQRVQNGGSRGDHWAHTFSFSLFDFPPSRVRNRILTDFVNSESSNNKINIKNNNKNIYCVNAK